MPVESHEIRLALLFQVHVLHHYWLDEGATIYDQLPHEVRKQRLASYDVRSILEIRPTLATERRLAGLGGVWRATALGLLVAVPDQTRVPDASLFEFTLRSVDPRLESYTAYGLVRPSTRIVHDPSTGRRLRYRADAAVYSNLEGCSRATVEGWRPFLTREIPEPSAADRIEYLVHEGGLLKQLVRDPHDPRTVALGPRLDLPAFATHADVPALAPIAGLEGELPERGILLPDDAPADTWALLRIAAVHPVDPDFGCTAGGLPKPAEEEPRFQLRFKNRRTLWRRVRSAAPESEIGVEGPLPLTWHGNAGTAQKPHTGLVEIEGSQDAIDNLVSTVFV